MIVTRNVRLGFCIGLSLLGAARLLGAPFHESAPLLTTISGQQRVPAEVTDRGIYVTAMINGQGPFRFLVDTGCSFSMISPEVAAAVDARGIDQDSEGGVQALNGLGDVLSMPRVMLDSVELGGVEFDGVVAGVVPLELQSKVESRTLDGLLGYSLFSDLFLALDFPRHQLVLSRDWPSGLPPVRAELAITEQEEAPFVRVTLQGRPFDVMIDTGANGRLHLPPQTAGSLEWLTPPRPGPLLAVAGEVGREEMGRLSGELDLGGESQPEPVAEISDGPPTLGTGILSGFCLVLSEAEGRLWLCSESQGPIPSPPERSVGLSLIAEAAGWRVAGIIPNSPAEAAAIRKGDLLTEIEGKPAQTWSREQIQDWIDVHPSLTLKLRSGQTERELALRVWLLVP